jgi:hypothetical protein
MNLGFLVVVLFGPISFLYHSWKRALAMLALGALWVAFLRETLIDLTENLVLTVVVVLFLMHLGGVVIAVGAIAAYLLAAVGYRNLAPLVFVASLIASYYGVEYFGRRRH